MQKLGQLIAIAVVVQVVAQSPAACLDSKTSKTAKTAKTAAPTKSTSTTSAQTSMMSRAGDAIKKRDFKEAHVHLEKLAACGNCGAHNLLGMIYENGLGVEKNMSKAISHYEFAAQRGVASAQHRLGSIYYRGDKVVPRNYKKARRWLRKAADQGSREARELLEQVPGVTQAELALQSAGDKFHQRGNQYQTGMNN